jgi:hypothetical protein
MRPPRRRTFWLSAAALLLVGIACAWFLIPQSRIARENYDRNRSATNLDEAIAILGKPDHTLRLLDEHIFEWHDGPKVISIFVADGVVRGRGLSLPTTWETLEWYVKKGAEKFGVKWR